MQDEHDRMLVSGALDPCSMDRLGIKHMAPSRLSATPRVHATAVVAAGAGGLGIAEDAVAAAAAAA